MHNESRKVQSLRFIFHRGRRSGRRYLLPLETVMCTTCGLVFSNPVPDPKTLERFYSRRYRFLYQGVSHGHRPADTSDDDGAPPVRRSTSWATGCRPEDRAFWRSDADRANSWPCAESGNSMQSGSSRGATTHATRATVSASPYTRRTWMPTSPALRRWPSS